MRKPEIFMPTEFLHGLYDGGHGAGLKDYWDMMMRNPRCAGGFLWDLADEGVVRTDKDGIVDCMGNFGSDGIVGPHFEKEGSYYTIREIWSPVEMGELAGDGLVVKNHYDFQNLNTCHFTYQYLKFPLLGESKTTVVKEGVLTPPDVMPHQEGHLSFRADGGQADALMMTVTDARGKEILTKVYDLHKRAVEQAEKNTGTVNYTYQLANDQLTVMAAGRTYHFDRHTGYLQDVLVDGRKITLKNGPRFMAARRSDRSYDGFYNHDDKEAEKKKTLYTEYPDPGMFTDFVVEQGKMGLQVKAPYRLGCLDSVCWTFKGDGYVAVDYSYHFGGVVDEMGVMFDYPEEKMESKSWLGKGPYRVWQNRLQGPQYGYWSNKYNDPIPGESWDYPEFKGYFADVNWMQLVTGEGKIDIWNGNANHYIGVYQPRDGRDQLLYTLPETGISFLDVIPAVRNKVNTTDLNGPSAQPFWAKNESFKGSIVLKFE
jgi:hypothetical protein